MDFCKLVKNTMTRYAHNGSTRPPSRRALRFFPSNSLSISGARVGTSIQSLPSKPSLPPIYRASSLSLQTDASGDCRNTRAMQSKILVGQHHPVRLTLCGRMSYLARNKVRNKAPGGLLQPLPIPEGPWLWT